MKQTLEQERAGVEAKLAALRVAPAAADLVRQADEVLAAHRAEIAALEGQMEQLDAELGVREGDRRAAAAKQREEQWQAQRQAVVAESEVWLGCVADAEAATRALVDALDRLFASNARLARASCELSISKKLPRALNVMDLASRMSGRISAVMATVKGHRHRLGAIDWQGGSLYQPPERCWRDEEERAMAAALIQPLLTKGKA